MTRWDVIDEDRVVDADPTPQPTYAKPSPAEPSPPKERHRALFALALIALAVLLLGGLLAAGVALQAGFVGWVAGVVVVAVLYSVLYAAIRPKR